MSHPYATHPLIAPLRVLALPLVLVFTVTGCDNPAEPDPNQDTATNAEASAAPAPVSAAPPSPPADFVHPTTEAALLETFQKAFETGEIGTIEALIYDGDVSDADRDITRMILLRNAGKGKIVRLEPNQDGFDPANWSLDAGTVFEWEYETDSSATVSDWAYGEVDSKYYLLAFNGNPE